MSFPRRSIDRSWRGAARPVVIHMVTDPEREQHERRQAELVRLLLEASTSTDEH
ncbi:MULTISPECIES: hypothetical protein [unclassified Mesorhizobium]|uniref:hypothetical protein n=1 Tax=unclassified Mesorhizobium TaxID=325217 RepID=UPI001926B611|nr:MULTISPECIES: hypothetical protein [unclassified Mesorhizobium]